MRKNNLVILFAALCGLASCAEKKEPGNAEAETTGKTSVICDRSIATLIEPVRTKFMKSFPEADVVMKTESAREAMRQLLAGNTRGVILARGYLRDEDSLMKAFGVKAHERFLVARDALVFFSTMDFPLDTLSKSDLENILSQKDAGFLRFYPQLGREPVLAVADSSSSEYANLQRLAAAGRPVQYGLKFFPSVEGVKEFVRNNPGAVGVGYLSQLARDGAFKMLRIGFYSDSAKQYVNPKPVHQSYVTMEQYPFPVEIYTLLFENRRRQPAWGFFSYLATDANAQREFLNAGIVPAYARIKIIEED